MEEIVSEYGGIIMILVTGRILVGALADILMVVTGGMI